MLKDKQYKQQKTDSEIAHAYRMQHIQAIAAKLKIPEKDLYLYGHYKAKVLQSFVQKISSDLKGKLILVTGTNPTKAGEGKTTTTIGIGDALSKLGKQSAICLREPSLGPCFGIKGGATGGGHAQVVPMEEINMHFTGDFHAITTAHNLLSAMLDNHLHWGNELKIHPKKIVWRRVLDMNDRALREITIGLGSSANGITREDGFDITVASEIMAIFCLATDLDDLHQKLGEILVAYTTDNQPIYAKDLNAHDAMTLLLKDAFQPNLVQTLEGTPAFVHGGPFANIAHGCSSVIATKTALHLADYVITEAGFGADLGAEKFFDIKCRKANLTPDAAVIVTTIRALKMHGGASEAQLKEENIDALRSGFSNLAQHVSNVQSFGVPTVVALNLFSSDTQEEIKILHELCMSLHVKLFVCHHWAQGGDGCLNIAKELIALTTKEKQNFRLLYDDSIPLWEKIGTIAKKIYGAAAVEADKKIHDELHRFERQGYGSYPICMAKTPFSFSTDPKKIGAPKNHTIHITGLRLANGAQFIVVLCGDVMTMPGLPKIPAAVHMKYKIT